ncbi:MULTISPECIES: hypothetical protein [unclassified Desulfovibrio]|uniref:hypothetical protein n=1 Tax=unclassified Desulfovibrio TaxID=2593640 RepID=UPI0013EDEFBC|nr:MULTISPECIES: hypothetical protein [unclassified Desulfovibrio]
MARKKAEALPYPNPEMWEIKGELVQETEDAILLIIDDDEYWLPKSQISYDGERGDVVTVSVPDWLAKEKGLSDGDGGAYAQRAQRGASATSEPGEEDAPDAFPEGSNNLVLDADRTVDITLTIIAFSEDGESATVKVEGGEPCELSMADFTHDAESISEGDTLLCHVNLLAAMAAGLVGPDAPHADKGVTWLRKDKFERSFPLGDEEKLELGNRMAEAQQQIDDFEDELAGIRKEFKAKIELQQTILSDAAKAFRDGKSEPVLVECDVLQDWNTEELVFVACDDGVELFRRPMTAEEKHPTLFTSAPGGAAPLGEDPRKRHDIPTATPMTWGHTCVDCAHLFDKESGQSEECATCAQAVEGGTDNWTARRECKTCNYRTMSVKMPPCSGCSRNPEYQGAPEDADDYWVIAANSADANAPEDETPPESDGKIAGAATGAIQ